MKNIHVIPTENSSRLHKVLQSTFILKEEPAFAGKLFKSTPQYIYITSEEKIIEGDWFINGNYIDKKAPKFSQRYAMNSNYVFSNPKQISLETDPDLIKDGVQAIDDEFLEWFVKNPKCEEVETYSLGIQNGKTGESGHCKYEIIIPTEEPKQDYKKLSEEFTETLKSIPDDVLFEYAEPKQETIEEFIEREGYHEGRTHDIWEEGVREGAAWQAERMYSEEDIERAFHEGVKSKATFLEWFEQFKKQKS